CTKATDGGNLYW
nr:immunoglobulin heavy chain junction region [Macaca mulatta]MOY30740.1 immunoglobulin heavy chain junction region [Macaca mulatta]